MHKHSNIDGLELLRQSHVLFPDWSNGQRVRWVKAKQYVIGRFTMSIGEKGIDHEPPDFLRALPRPQQLTVERGSGDYVREVRRLIEGRFA